MRRPHSSRSATPCSTPFTCQTHERGQVANETNGLARGEGFPAVPPAVQQAIGIMTIPGYGSDMFARITTSGPRHSASSLSNRTGTPPGTSPTGHRHPRAHRGGAIGRGRLAAQWVAAGVAEARLGEGTGEVTFALAPSVGDTWLLTALWKKLGSPDAFRRLLRNRHQSNADRRLRNRSLPLRKSCEHHDLYGIVAELADDLTDAT